MGVCLKRVLDNWEPLTLFFQQQTASTKQLSSKSTDTNKRAKTRPPANAIKVSQHGSTGSKVKGGCHSSEGLKVASSTKPIIHKAGSGNHGASSSFLQEVAAVSTKSSKCPKSTKQKEGQTAESAVVDAGASLKREHRIMQVLTSKRSHVYALFVHFAVSTIFDPINIHLQSEEPLIYKLRRMLLDLCKDILM